MKRRYPHPKVPAFLIIITTTSTHKTVLVINKHAPEKITFSVYFKGNTTIIQTLLKESTFKTASRMTSCQSNLFTNPPVVIWENNIELLGMSIMHVMHYIKEIPQKR